MSTTTTVRNVQLVSSDNESFEVAAAVAQMSALVQTMIEGKLVCSRK